jgi:hypothetical protein
MTCPCSTPSKLTICSPSLSRWLTEAFHSPMTC